MVWKDKAAVFGSVQQDRRPRQGGRVPSTIGRLHPTGRSEEPLLLREKKKKNHVKVVPGSRRQGIKMFALCRITCSSAASWIELDRRNA